MAWNDDLEATSPAYGIAASEERRIRVLAGPGAGKSFAMKRRIARLLEQGTAPETVLAVTFTRVAAEDLHRELSSMDVEGADRLTGRTVHGLAMSILMRNHVLPVLGRAPRPLNEYELHPLLEDLSPTHGTKHERRRRIKAYEAAWARLQHHQPGHAQAQADIDFNHDLVDWLRFHEAMLIGEVIPHLYQYLVQNPAAQELVEFAHVLIDEYQDLNRVEQEVLSLLGSRAAMCVIGDDDQSIYSFKHAHPDGVREWCINAGRQDHAIAECRRCPTTIVRMANSLISQNRNRTPRQMRERPENGPGQVVIGQYPTERDEAQAVATKIRQLVANGTPPGSIIVLAQRRTFANPVFHLLRDAGVPVKSYYAEAALDSDAAQERYALLKLVLNPEDRVALRWLLGFGDSRWRANAYRRVSDHCHQHGLSPREALSQMSAGILRIPHTSSLVTRFEEIEVEIQALTALNTDLPAFCQAWLSNPATVSLLAELVEGALEGAGDLETFFDQLSNAITEPDVPAEIEEVRVMSLHKSKGLSSPYVFIVGCVEGLIPGAPQQGATLAETAAKLEEDRRLLFVGVTRAKADPAQGLPGYLALTYPQTMNLGDAFQSQITPVSTRGQIAFLRASRFIGELGPASPAPTANSLL